MAACSGKSRYETREEADAVIQRIASRERRGSRDKRARKPYKCEHCGGYHLSGTHT